MKIPVSGTFELCVIYSLLKIPKKLGQIIVERDERGGGSGDRDDSVTRGDGQNFQIYRVLWMTL